ncbi:MAG: pilV [Polaromonas sp.]|nr:pilV [Polaromonas sp.]
MFQCQKTSLRTEMTKSGAKQSGVTLVEVLVSIMLMSFALLGMAAMQAQSLAQQTSATSRANISTLVADVTDRMRTNLTQSPGYDTGVSTPTFSISSTWAGQTTVPSAPSTDCNASVCDAVTRASYDLTNWRRKVRAEIPQGSAQISGGAQTGVNITLMWFDKDFRSGETARQSATCTAAMTGGAAQTCCPSTASAPAGVRCHNTTILP